MIAASQTLQSYNGEPVQSMIAGVDLILLNTRPEMRAVITHYLFCQTSALNEEQSHSEHTQGEHKQDAKRPQDLIH